MEADGDGVAYDVAYEEAVADIVSVRVLLMDNRPLAALKTVREAEKRHKKNTPDREMGE